ncbi:uncharacterized protein LOC143342960 [Colletes latitarsis]|uniref:uncharacterized protein LOC143342960 n=1 Tax=Colletes latitarsis TaxID=2605962 RepID=UPI0040357023
MTDNGPCRSTLGKLFGCVNSGINWNINQIKSACPPKKKKTEDKIEESKKSLDEGLDDADSADKKKIPYTSPSEICPTVKSCCVIKMQDPCAPCCCEMKPTPPPCPPRSGYQKPRQSTCGCDLCQKNPDNEKCCDRNTAFRNITIDPRYFEKA